MVKVSACTNPRGNLWLKDKSHIGFKLMQKMGWAEGKGLGAKEDGKIEAIKVRQKNDVKGVGYRNNNDNNWLEHQDEFNALLSRLNKDSVEPSTKMIISLEEKSKSSKNRLHYHKYTRGKDLSSCNEKDMACILGKRKNENIDAELEASNIVTNKMSYQDYFSQKQSLRMNDKDKSEELQKFPSSKNHRKRRKDEFCSDFEECLPEANEEFDHVQSVQILSKKKKLEEKKEASIHDADESLSEAEKEERDPLQTTQCVSKKRKHERKKAKRIHDFEEGLSEAEKEECEPLKKKKHKRKKETLSCSEPDPKEHEGKNKLYSGTCEEAVLNLEECLGDSTSEALDCKEIRHKTCRHDKRKLTNPELLDDQLEGEITLKKRKRKLKSGSSEIILGENNIQENKEIEVKSNKKKVNKIKGEEDCDNVTTLLEYKVNVEEHEPENLRTKKFKRKNESDKSNEDAIIESANCTTADEQVVKKKEFVIGLLTTFRHPSESLPDLFQDIMSSEHFNGSNFFSIKGYGGELF